MNLTVYLRSELNKYWIGLVKKDSCEICGGKENLELHLQSNLRLSSKKVGREKKTVWNVNYI